MPRGGPAPAEEIPGHRSGGSDDRRRGISERGEERVRRAGEHREPSGRSVPVHDAGRFRRALRRRLHPLSDPRYAGAPRPPHGRAEPHGAAGDHRPLPCRGHRRVPRGPVRDVRLRTLIADAAVGHRAGPVPRDPDPGRGEQGGPRDTRPRTPRDVLANGGGRRKGPRGGGAPRYQPRSCSRSSGASWLISIPFIAPPRPFETSAITAGSSKWVTASTMERPRASGFSDLKIPLPTNTPSHPSCIIKAASAGVARPPAAKFTTGSRWIFFTSRRVWYTPSVRSSRV